MFNHVIRRPCWYTKQWQIIAHVLHDNRDIFPKDYFLFLFCASTCWRWHQVHAIYRSELVTCSTSLQMERLWFVELWPNRSSLQSRVSLTGKGTQLGRTDASYLRTDRCQPILTNAEDYFHKWRRTCYYFFLHKLECFNGVPTTEKNRENYVNFSRVCDSQSAADMLLALFGAIDDW